MSYGRGSNNPLAALLFIRLCVSDGLFLSQMIKLILQIWSQIYVWEILSSILPRRHQRVYYFPPSPTLPYLSVVRTSSVNLSTYHIYQIIVSFDQLQTHSGMGMSELSTGNAFKFELGQLLKDGFLAASVIGRRTSNGATGLDAEAYARGRRFCSCFTDGEERDWLLDLHLIRGRVFI